ncbi:hypothetical protein [Dyella sp. GSA-30]|uniref:hypothetical protein n=1 Tax=Dyella sp. GSA-30 TaxID=2994496 RepID=UPI00248FC512|nr:hypothetical protein [Dyella sp. GSA-30]BDU20849.1 hypothetical protein DYGSA30_23060 [Dyella sp. GSA-30]
MIVRRAIALSIGCLIAAAAMAGDNPPAQAGKQKAKLDRQLDQQSAQVQQLQQDVAQQEAKSRAAAQRGQQQDQAIEDLRRQLKEVQATKGQGH